ncbi:MAG TPA: (d)CMP kinase [Ruminococcaceae bacterium]|nr:(d)CMP kinase [Oscillospiraceae bacterium]
MISIAIDGPAGAGKSTIARALSKQIKFIYVDTGALYRAVGLYAVRNGADTKSPEQVAPLLSKIKVELKYENSEQRVFLNGEDVSEAIRENSISMAASNVSAIPSVREFLFDLQRNIAKSNNVVMDGRDIGTVVLPNAQIKIFLTATPEDRAKRRYDELVLKGADVNYEDILSDVKQRDYNDTNRPIAPLKQAEDAILIDTTGFTLEQAIQTIFNTVDERLKKLTSRVK